MAEWVVWLGRRQYEASRPWAWLTFDTIFRPALLTKNLSIPMWTSSLPWFVAAEYPSIFLDDKERCPSWRQFADYCHMAHDHLPVRAEKPPQPTISSVISWSSQSSIFALKEEAGNRQINDSTIEIFKPRKEMQCIWEASIYKCRGVLSYRMPRTRVRHYYFARSAGDRQPAHRDDLDLLAPAHHSLSTTYVTPPLWTANVLVFFFSTQHV